MSKHDKLLEDKFASSAVSFSDAPKKSPGEIEVDLAMRDMTGFSSIERKKQEAIEAERKPTLVERKMRRIFGAAGEFQKLFIQGAMMGAVVGGTFGAIAGTYYAFLTRSFWYIPMSALGSGASFGFMMGIGMVIRNQMEDRDSTSDEDYMLVKLSADGRTLEHEPVYKRYQL